MKTLIYHGASVRQGTCQLESWERAEVIERNQWM